MLKIATWNINSIRVRLPQLKEWLNQHQPLLFALQETKVEDEKFPRAAIEEMGYHVIFTGQKSYNGVAILSRDPPQNILTCLPNSDDLQKRFIAATYHIPTPNGGYPLRLINLYIPNGESVTSEKYQYKLKWLASLEKFLAQEIQQHQHISVVGDFNIAPAAEDVYDPLKWEGRVLFSEPEHAHFKQLISLGFCDAFREKPQEPNSFSWWDYRTFAFRRNHGLRIDHILITPSLAKEMTNCYIDKNLRGNEQPSDHAPVVVTFKGTSESEL